MTHANLSAPGHLCPGFSHAMPTTSNVFRQTAITVAAGHHETTRHHRGVARLRARGHRPAVETGRAALRPYPGELATGAARRSRARVGASLAGQSRESVRVRCLLGRDARGE